MAIVSVLAALIFSTALCYIEIPKMLQDKLFRELWTFSALLVFGTVLAILKSLDVNIPNPSDFIAWVYSPVREVIKSLLR